MGNELRRQERFTMKIDLLPTDEIEEFSIMRQEKVHAVLFCGPEVQGIRVVSPILPLQMALKMCDRLEHLSSKEDRLNLGFALIPTMKR
jgi:hypothetical protein